ncbi:MAG: 4Fe-4S ferredoxin, partial [Deltaproteobacteria bacterium]|nr:4Fe-4S ferredoxin [Deltaproteobacteria bacterium]
MGISDKQALVVYSSPAGTTRHVAQVIMKTLDPLGYKPRVSDLGIRDDLKKLNSLIKDLVNGGCLWIGSPVYAGHAVPPITYFILQLPVSKGGYAVPFVTWGGVSSGVALHEMGKVLGEKGYIVLGAAKVLAVHSMMWQFKNPLGEG